MMSRFGCAIAALSVTASPALAWEHQTDFRGLEIYDFEATGIDVQIICDPQGAFVPPIYSARLRFSQEDYNGEAILQSGDASFTFEMKHGSVLPSDGPGWTSLIQGLRSGSDLVLTADGQTLTLDTGSPFPVTCGATI
ncbi:hypothetical protein ACIPCF_18845 (plasmid) [Paracoccus marcusii]|uniref:hypothetical protein n=1 Tax=Paracoccus marcusii TaxID=59779 RepID=UPI0038B98913